MTILTRLTLLFLLLPLLANAQETNSPLDLLKKAYGKSRSDIATAHQQQKTDLLATYDRSLKALLDDLKKKGDLDNFLVAQKEQKRFLQDKTVPTAETAEGIVSESIAGYWKKVDMVALDEDVQVVKLLKQYGAALDDLIRKFMMADKIEEAKGVKEEKDRAMLVLADLEKTVKAKVEAAPPAPVAPSVAPPAPGPAAATNALKPILWNTLGSRREIETSKIGPGGTLQGQPLFVPGKEGMGVSLRENSGIRFDPDFLPGPDRPATYELWFRTPDKLTRPAMLMWASQGSAVAGILILLDPADRRLTGGMCNQSGSDFFMNEELSPALELNRWYHLALVWDFADRIDGHDTFRVYLDGEITFRTAASRTDLNPFGPSSSHANLTLGAQGYMGNLDSGFGGTLDEFKVYDRVMTNFNLPRMPRARLK